MCGFQRKAKVADKTQHTMNWLVYAHNMIIGNGRASTLLKIDGGKIGASMLEEALSDFCLWTSSVLPSLMNEFQMSDLRACVPEGF